MRRLDLMQPKCAVSWEEHFQLLEECCFGGSGMVIGGILGGAAGALCVLQIIMKFKVLN